MHATTISVTCSSHEDMAIKRATAEGSDERVVPAKPKHGGQYAGSEYAP